MPEARDRLLRPGNDADQMLKRLWRSSGSIRIGSDESPVALVLNTASPVVTTRPRAPVRNLYRRYWGNENRAASGRRGRILPCCYPRKPLQDITSLVRVLFPLLSLCNKFDFEIFVFVKLSRCVREYLNLILTNHSFISPNIIIMFYLWFIYRINCSSSKVFSFEIKLN